MEEVAILSFLENQRFAPLKSQMIGQKEG